MVYTVQIDSLVRHSLAEEFYLNFLLFIFVRIKLGFNINSQDTLSPNAIISLSTQQNLTSFTKFIDRQKRVRVSRLVS